MTHTRMLSGSLLALLITVGCDEAPTQPIGEDIAATTALAASQGQPTRTTSPVLLWDDPSHQTGTSTLARTRNGVNFTLATSELTPDEVVTLWMVVFNNPEHCEDGCDIPDFFNPLVQADALYADGRVIGPNGRANYAGSRNVGDARGSIFPAWLGLPAYGILDANKAEIHFVVHSHGPKIPGLVGEMLKTFNAGCAPTFMDIPVPEELGTHGPNTCQDVQFTMHLPAVQ
jgi:hypothetical protein